MTIFQRYYEGEAKYEQVTKEEMAKRQLEPDNYIENQMVCK